jgi:hypothetical protein
MTREQREEWRNPAKAADRIAQYRKAAEQGDAEAQFYVGEAYYEGDGLAQDYSLAVKWWLKAAEQGCAAAQHQLGCAYSSGEGVPRDYVQAYKWFTLEWNSAFEIGPKVFYSPSSAEQRGWIRRFMTPAQVGVAKQLVKEWQSTPGSLGRRRRRGRESSRETPAETVGRCSEPPLQSPEEKLAKAQADAEKWDRVAQHPALSPAAVAWAR